jgi:methanogenic corrinoid protein MtbC1
MDGQRIHSLNGAALRQDAVRGGCGEHRGGAVDDPLVHLVAETVIPELLLSCRGNAQPRTPTRVHVDTLARLLLSRDETAASAQIAALAQSGMSADVLLHDLVTPAARRLGEFWHADSVNFVDVTMAMTRLTAIVRSFSRRTGRAGPVPLDAPEALIATTETERHGLGSLIVAESFRVSGWAVREMPGIDRHALGKAVAEFPYALVGLSVGSEKTAAALPTIVATLRRRSCNRQLIVALGGPAVVADPDCAARCGADFVATDGRDAVRLAERHLPKPTTTEDTRFAKS